MKTFHSEHEGYTHLLIQQHEIKKTMENIQLQMSFVLMNVQKGNFAAHKEHAAKELGYLISAANRLQQQSADLAAMGTAFQNMLNEREIRESGDSNA